MKVYMDNTSGTPLDDEVFNAMVPYLQNQYGAPHLHGKEAHTIIETCRQKVAKYLNTEVEEISFISGGNEPLKIAMISAIESTGIDHVITTQFEHAVILDVLNISRRKQDTRISYVKHHADGSMDLHHLEFLLRTHTRNLVTITHASIETGNLNDIGRISGLCEYYKALLHIDAIQTLGQYRYDLSKLKTHFLSASADKFYGPKGIGLLYSRKLTNFSKTKYDQDFEDIPNAIGLTKALEIAYRDLVKRKEYIGNLKKRLIGLFAAHMPNQSFLGNSAIQGKSHFAVVSIKLPKIIETQNLLQYLDEYHIAVSVKSGIDSDTVHFSLSKYNTSEEVAYVFDKLSGLCKAESVLKAS